MVEFKKYREYTWHNKAFNVAFSTVIAVLISIFLGTLFYLFGWFQHEWSVLLVALLVAPPAIIFVQKNANYEGNIAYHYQWADLWHGIKDRKRIKGNYAKSHGIKNWRKYLKRHGINLRWDYHVHTKYMERLASSRNSVLIKIAEEYAETQSALQAKIKNLNAKMAELERLKDNKENELKRIHAKLQKNSTGAQEYDLTRQQTEKQDELSAIISQITALTCELNNLTSEAQQYDAAFVSQKNKVEQDYKLRNDKYARIATSTIEKTGLKYEVDALALPDYWINNPTTKKEM